MLALAILALILAFVALSLGLYALRKTGLLSKIKKDLEAIGDTTDPLRSKPAGALGRLEAFLRGRKPPSTPQGG